MSPPSGGAAEMVTPEGLRVRVEDPKAPPGRDPMRMEGNPNSNWIANLRSPSSRHYLDKIDQKTVAKEWNTVIEPNVKVNEDLSAIRAGNVRLESDRFILPNGRIYGHHDGTLYPISGPGFHRLDRGTFKALGVYNQFGNTNKANQILNNMGISAEIREALNVWRLGQ